MIYNVTRARLNLRILNIRKHQTKSQYQNIKAILSQVYNVEPIQGKGVNRLENNFDGKSYDNVEFTSISEKKERKWCQYCFRIAANVMFTRMSEKK